MFPYFYPGWQEERAPCVLLSRKIRPQPPNALGRRERFGARRAETETRATPALQISTARTRMSRDRSRAVRRRFAPRSRLARA